MRGPATERPTDSSRNIAILFRMLWLLSAFTLCGCLQSPPLVYGRFAPAPEMAGDWSVTSDGKEFPISVTKLTEGNIFGIAQLDEHKFYTAVFLTSKYIRGYLMILSVSGQQLYAVVQPEEAGSWRIRFITIRKDDAAQTIATFRALAWGMYIKRGALGVYELGGKVDWFNVSELFADLLFIGTIDFLDQPFRMKPAKFPPDYSSELRAAKLQEFERLMKEMKSQRDETRKEIYETQKDIERLLRQQ